MTAPETAGRCRRAGRRRPPGRRRPWRCRPPAGRRPRTCTVPVSRIESPAGLTSMRPFGIAARSVWRSGVEVAPDIDLERGDLAALGIHHEDRGGAVRDAEQEDLAGGADDRVRDRRVGDEDLLRVAGQLDDDRAADREVEAAAAPRRPAPEPDWAIPARLGGRGASPADGSEEERGEGQRPGAPPEGANAWSWGGSVRACQRAMGGGGAGCAAEVFWRGVWPTPARTMVRLVSGRLLAAGGLARHRRGCAARARAGRSAGPGRASRPGRASARGSRSRR